MHLIEDLTTLSTGDIEEIEKLTLRWAFQAVVQFGNAPCEIFRDSSDKVQDIAEDITRELLDQLAGYNIPQRLLGNVDYRRARYIILPNQVIRQALFTDSKAETSKSSGRMQMSQLSLRIIQVSGGAPIDESGKLDPITKINNVHYLTTTVLLHYWYETTNSRYRLKRITLCAVPNGLLQNIYNPSVQDGIWNAGSHASSRGEDFRVRIGFAKLEQKQLWRVQRINFDAAGQMTAPQWQE